MPDRSPTLMPLGDSAILLRFSDRLDDAANAAAISAAHRISAGAPWGVRDIVPSLVSVLVTYDPVKTGYESLAGALRLLIEHDQDDRQAGARHIVDICFGGEGGPDLELAASLLGVSATEFVARHNALPLRVLAAGFAPGFVYCGLHSSNLHLPRRQTIRHSVPAGSILFAAGQTAITATPIPTGWYVIGRTEFRNFDPARNPATTLRPGDCISFRSKLT